MMSIALAYLVVIVLRIIINSTQQHFCVKKQIVTRLLPTFYFRMNVLHLVLLPYQRINSIINYINYTKRCNSHRNIQKNYCSFYCMVQHGTIWLERCCYSFHRWCTELLKYRELLSFVLLLPVTPYIIFSFGSNKLSPFGFQESFGLLYVISTPCNLSPHP